MGSLTVRVLSVVGAALLSVMMFGSGVAAAKGPVLIGKTYSDATAVLAKWGATPVIATVSGDQLATDDCIVTNFQKSSFLNAAGKNTRTNEYLLHLNCNNRVAQPGKPGNSAMSEEGEKEKQNQKYAIAISKNPAVCDKSDVNMEWCKKICSETGLCEV